MKNDSSKNENLNKKLQNDTNLQDNNVNFAENINDCIQKLKSDIIEFDSNENQFNAENIVLGELLTYLRKNKFMSLLMICKNIKQVKIDDGVVEIKLCDECKNILHNDKYKQILKEFFNSKNLDIKYTEEIVETNDADELNKLLGGKLIIKNLNKSNY